MATPNDKDGLLYLARLAEQCDEFDEMLKYVIDFSKANKEELKEDEKNILSVAFKNVVGTRRASWRVISLIERKETKKGATANAEKACAYKTIIEEELTGICH